MPRHSQALEMKHVLQGHQPGGVLLPPATVLRRKKARSLRGSGYYLGLINIRREVGASEAVVLRITKGSPQRSESLLATGLTVPGDLYRSDRMMQIRACMLNFSRLPAALQRSDEVV